MSLPLARVIAEIEDLSLRGVTFHWLHPKQKRPRGNDWSQAPLLDLAGLKSSHRDDDNIGVRLGESSKTSWGYLHLIDVDIRKPECKDECFAKLRELVPDALSFPTVRSGSGGESLHLYFICPVPLSSKKLAMSEGSEQVWSDHFNRYQKKNDWEIDLLGTGKQAVVPPSIHPDTGLPYVWEKKFDFDDLDLGMGPFLSESTVTKLGAHTATASSDDMEDIGDFLMADIKGEPIDISEDEILKIVADLPESWLDDRDAWFQTGMALHHQFRGLKRGYEIWCGWAKQSEKFNEKDSRRVWRSFGKRNRTNPVRMPTLIQAAKETRFNRDFIDVEGDDEDLFGTESKAATSDSDELDLLGGGSDELDLLGESDDDFDILGEAGEVTLYIAPKTKVGDPSQLESLTTIVGDIAGIIEKNGLPWRSKLDLNKETGDVKSHLHNVFIILAFDPRLRGCFGYNEFSNKFVLIRPPATVMPRRVPEKGYFQFRGAIWQVPDKENGRNLEDAHIHQLRLMFETPRTQGGWGIKVSDRDLKSGFNIVGTDNTVHPLRDRLCLLRDQWDGERGRLETMFIRYLGCPDTPYYRQTSRIFMIAAVTRIFEPGHKFDQAPILQGGQGIRKSTFIRTLALGYGGELDIDFKDMKRMIESCMGRWIIEMPELSGFKKTESEHMKRYMTTTVDDYRVPYGIFQQRIERQYLFMGSTNDNAYLRDETGNRRYWPIKVEAKSIDIEALEKELPLIYGEAVAEYFEMREKKPYGDLPLYLSNAEVEAEAKAIQEGARVQTSADILAEGLREWLDNPIDAEFEELDNEDAQYRDRVSSKIIVTEFMELDARKTVSPVEINNINTAMKLLKDEWEYKSRVRFSENGKTWVTTGWVRIGTIKTEKKVKHTPGKYRTPDIEELLG